MTRNHFELFDLAPCYALDAEQLERSYKELQSLVHPDRHVQAVQPEQRASMQWTTRVNDAYRILKDPVQRAKHILELHGVDVAFETNTQMPSDFLIQQLETREQLEEAIQKKNSGFLDSLRGNLAAKKKVLEIAIGESIDARKDYAGAVDHVRKLMFLERLDAELDAAYEAAE